MVFLSLAEVRVLLGEDVGDVEPIDEGLDQILRERLLVLVKGGSDHDVVFVPLFEGEREEGTMEAVARDAKRGDDGGEGRWWKDVDRHEGEREREIKGWMFDLHGAECPSAASGKGWE